MQKTEEIRFDRTTLVANLMFLTVAAAFSWYFASLRFAQPEWGPASLQEIMNGTANTPFQYRVLVPWIANWFATHLLPLPGIGTARGLVFLIEIASTFFLLVAFRYYLSFFIPDLRARTLMTFFLIAVLPFNYLISRLYPFWVVYDIPSLLFLMLGLILIHQRRWPLYYALFVVATFNRETTCFLTLAYLFTAFGKEKFSRIAAHCAAQFVIWYAIKHFLFVLYASNPGAGMGLDKLGDNLCALLGIIWGEPSVPGGAPHRVFHPVVWAVMGSTVAFTWIPTLIYYRQIRDEFVRRACLVVPFFFLIMLYTGNLPEVRIYGDMIPFIFPAFLLLLKETMVSGNPGVVKPG